MKFYLELWSEDWLRYEYVTNGRSSRDIAREIGCHSSSVLDALKRYGIPKRDPGPYKLPPKSPAVIRTRHSWTNMVTRCINSNDARWLDYGGRGIRVCDRWRLFKNFLEDMGVRPEWATGGLDRINVDSDYEPGNCRWATSAEQHANKRKRRTSSVQAPHRDVVYFLKVLTVVKIGCTCNITRRTQELRKDLRPYKVTLLGVVDGYEVEEAAFHQQFHQHRLTRSQISELGLSGWEWFREESVLQVAPWEEILC